MSGGSLLLKSLMLQFVHEIQIMRYDCRFDSDIILIFVTFYICSISSYRHKRTKTKQLKKSLF